MNTFARKSRNDHGQPASDGYAQRASNASPTRQHVDNRPAAVAQRELDESLNQSAKVQLQSRLQQSLNQSPSVVAQAKLAAALNAPHSASQPQTLQRRDALEDEETTQRKTVAEEEESLQKQQPIQKRENRTGLPDKLKAGVENLSGLPMDDVKVHYNSSAPATVQALAYTQGTDIHVAPGQEKHLAHEAWHVAQQKQGRVRPTIQTKGVAVNDDQALEQEADVMGARASQGQVLPKELRPDRGVQAQAVQLLKVGYANSETKRHFILDKPGGNVSVLIQEIGGKQNGYAKFDVVDRGKEGKAMVLHTINTRPEEGSGLGSLLMYYMAVEAVKADCKVIEIEDAAWAAVSFYEHMGGKPNKPELVKEHEGLYGQLDPKDVLNGLADEAVVREYERKNYESKDYIIFDKLPAEQKKKMRADKREEFQKLSKEEQAKMVQARVHAKAVSGLGAMLADPKEMLEKTAASIVKRWAEEKIAEPKGEDEQKDEKKDDDKKPKIEEAKPLSTGSKCFLTTACVEALGLPDDCLELTVLRRFRDNWLRAHPGGAATIEEYYRIAPLIIDALAREERSHELLLDLYQRLVRRSVALILAGQYEEAFAHYQQVVRELRARFLPPSKTLPPADNFKERCK
jgi:hypothetical protein